MTTITFAGHSAALIELNGTVVAIDPWLKGNPSCPEELHNPERIDYIVLTHGHADHASDAVRLATQYDARVVATYELAQLLMKQGVAQEKAVPMNKGGSVTSEEGITFSLTHAMHSNSFDTDAGPAYAGEACGVVVSNSETAVYHAGDTALFGDMKLIAEQYAPAVALLPIGDHFTMGPVEAAKAASLVGAKTVIPIHFNTFPVLTGTPEEFQNALKDDTVAVIVLEPGQSHSY